MGLKLNNLGAIVSTISQPAAVSPNNPCPFLRALVSQGLVPDDKVPLSKIASVVVDVAAKGEGNPKVPGVAVQGVALIANGLGPVQLARNILGGVRLNELRSGPLNKHGSGSGILDENAEINAAQLARLDEFASDKTDTNGKVERGLNIAEITRMMDANFDRAIGRRRAIDRKLMDQEWPVLLKIMGKKGKSGRYLGLKDVANLFIERRFPERMMALAT
jgi:hypothetical protein